MLWNSNRSIELDVYLPKEKLAFEYQGEHHYGDVHAMGNKWMQRQMDEEKRRMCAEKEITLIEIPYWWNNERSSLVATIHKYRPDLIPLEMVGDGMAIGDHQGSPVGTSLADLMYGEDWNGQQDLSGWWLSEKMDGVRAYWTGEKLMTRYGNEIPCPDWFIAGFPSDVRLDGELWLGRGRYEEVMSSLVTGGNDEELWRAARYVIFDLPSSKQPYETRLLEVRNIPKLPPHVEIVSTWQCRGNEDLANMLSGIVKDGGEGLMAVEPHSTYAPGERTNRLLKVKLQDDNQVQVVEILPTGFRCIQ